MIKYNFLNIILFLFLKTVFCYSINQNKNTLDAMAQAGHDNKEGHPSSPSKLLTQLAGKILKNATLTIFKRIFIAFCCKLL